MRHSHPRVGIVAVLLLVLLAAPSPAQAPSDTKLEGLEKALMKAAPGLVRDLRDRLKYRTVGVLKFLVQTPDGRLTDSHGALNLTLAQQVELALVLGQPPREKELRILTNTSARAAKLPGANHRTPAGRKVLLGAKYAPAWGEGELLPDALLTGVAKLDKGLDRMQLEVLSFDARSADLERRLQLVVAPSVATLGGAGESFLLRGGLRSKLPEELRALLSAVKVRDGKVKHPLEDAEAPLTLEVRYDGKPIALRYSRGQAEVPEPREGQKVELVVRRREKSKDRYALVLKVNGENTLFRERLPDDQCAKWVLPADQEELVVRGFHRDTKKREPFAVLSTGESKKDEVRYGADVGLITLAVFAERTSPPDGPSLEVEEEDRLTLVRGELLPPAPNMLALRARLRQGALRGAGGSRGLVVGGKAEESALREVGFAVDPVPIMQAAVRYYKADRAGR